MKLRDIEFPPIMNASGAQGFFGEGYSYHKWYKHIGLTFDGCGFIAKTTTLFPRKGNMPLKADGTSPSEWKPKCIKVKFRQGVVLNAVGLSGPGARALLEDGRWQNRTEPFFLSFMAVASDVEERLTELYAFVELLMKYKQRFKTTFGLEINFSCPNVALDPGALITEVNEALNITSLLDIPLQCKFNVLASPFDVWKISQHPGCDAITISNTIPWGKLPECVPWKKIFGTTESPLARMGGGGLSGEPLLGIVTQWIQTARNLGVEKPIWACGGIMSPGAVMLVKENGASGVQIGSVAILRPWRMKSIIRQTYYEFDRYSEASRHFVSL